MTIIKTISISNEFEQLAKEHNISWTNAARIGMSMILAEMGVSDYDNNLNLYRKMTQLKAMLEQVSNEYDELKSKYEAKEKK